MIEELVRDLDQSHVGKQIRVQIRKGWIKEGTLAGVEHKNGLCTLAIRDGETVIKATLSAGNKVQIRG